MSSLYSLVSSLL